MIFKIGLTLVLPGFAFFILFVALAGLIDPPDNSICNKILTCAVAISAIMLFIGIIITLIGVIIEIWKTS